MVSLFPKSVEFNVFPDMGIYGPHPLAKISLDNSGPQILCSENVDLI